MREELLFKQECYALQGAIFEVNRELGLGFLDPTCGRVGEEH